MPIYNTQTTSPINNGGLLLGGIAEGLKQGLLTYQQRQQYEDEKKQKNAMLSMQAQQQGLIYNPDAGTMSPGANFQNKQKTDELIKAYGILPEDQRMGSPGGRALMKNIFDRINPQQGQQGLIKPPEETPGITGRTMEGPQIPMAGAENRQPQGGLVGAPQTANDFELDPGYQTKKARALQQEIIKAQALHPINNPLEGTKLSNDMAKDLQKDLEPDAARTGNFGQISNRHLRAQALNKLATDFNGNPANLNSQQMEELGIGLAGMLGGGNIASDARVKGLVPSSGMKSAMEIKQWFLNQPTGTNQQKFVANMLGTINREGNLAADQMKEIQLRKLGSHSNLKKLDPQLYYSILDNYGISPEDEKGFKGKKDKGFTRFNEEPGGLLKSAKTPGANAHPADDAMLTWAKKNPQAPGAAEVLKANGM